MTKPFNPLELVARVKSQIRRYTKFDNLTETEKQNVYQSGGLWIDDEKKEVKVDGEPVINEQRLQFNILIYHNFERSYFQGEFFWISLECIAEASVMLVVFYSFLRRMKARTFWSTTFGAVCIRKIEKILNFSKVTKREIAKVLVIKGMQSIVLIILFAIALQYSSYYGTGAIEIGVVFICMVTTVLQVIAYVMEVKKVVLLDKVMCGAEKISSGEVAYQIPIEKEKGENAKLIHYINHIGDNFAKAVEESIKDERMKTELITNVSHDLKTPLTSMVNYVELLKREKIADEKINSYIAVLEEKSQQLKRLTEDLLEISKANSGNLVLEMESLNFVELINQANGEFREKFRDKNLCIVDTLPKEQVIIRADGDRLWRVLENLYGNVEKYAMEHTRVYIQLTVKESMAEFAIKNISSAQLNINPDKLMERFIRGDEARTTEGSGLGLAIAKSLVELQGGTFKIYLDGDLFRVTVRLPIDGQRIVNVNG